MATNTALAAERGNDVTVRVQVTKNDVPLNVSSLSLNFYLKASSKASDATATVYAIGSGITLVTPTLGIVNVTIPHDSTWLATPGAYWWRLDVIDGGAVNSAMYGPFYVLAV